MLARPTLSLGDAAACLGCSETTLRGAIRRGELKLPVLAIGSRRIVTSAAIKALLGIVP